MITPMIPMEMPNRRFPVPPPFVYHPELFPELAGNNPAPKNFTIPKKQPNAATSKNANTQRQHKLNSQKSAKTFSVVDSGDEQRFVMPTNTHAATYENYQTF